MIPAKSKSNKGLTAVLFVMSGLFFTFHTAKPQTPDSIRLKDPATNIYAGVVIGENGEKLAYAAVAVEETNISTVTNSEGEFVLKIPLSAGAKNMLISFMGYENLRVPLSSLKPSDNKIRLRLISLTLPELEVVTKDPVFIIRKMMENKDRNYSNKDFLMTAFYRETIKKRNTNISLSESLVELYKSAYNSNHIDMASLYKSRKSTDYNKLDTLVFKLMGGPFNNIYLDVMRYPVYFFTEDIFGSYEFTFHSVGQIGDRTMYVIGFKQRRHITDPLFYGKLYVDMESYALVRAEFDMNLENADEATRVFIRKKPSNAKAKITKASYVIDYRLIDDWWHYSYSRVDLGLRINWKRKLFHTYYNANIEMAATNWSDEPDRRAFRNKDRINQLVIIQDQASGFSDPEFWGVYNIIEPDKSIENAITKIQKQLNKDK